MKDSNKNMSLSSMTGVREGVRKIIVQQYLLHEVEHHTLPSSELRSNIPLTPKAHQIMDIYKCLHQCEFGVGHTIDYPDRFKQRLLLELRTCASTMLKAAPILEDISPDGQILRVNLCPLQHAMGTDTNSIVEQLSQVCFESARTTGGNPENFYETLLIFKDLNAACQLCVGNHIFAFPDSVVEVFLSSIKELGRKLRQVPVLSHSEVYRQLNRPSYRVVTRSAMENSPLSHFLKKDAPTDYGI